MAVRLILVCNEGPARNVYLREAMSLGIEVDAVSSFGEMMIAMLTSPYQGIMIDVATNLKAKREEKGMVQGVLNAFPLIQLRWDSQTNKIQTISSNVPTRTNLAHFVAYDCQPFSPRLIRSETRHTIHLNVEIYKDQNLTPAGMERSVTINVSKNGCFLFTCSNWAGITHIWLVFNELEDKTPLAAEILWRQTWGTSTAIPGLGVRITRMSDRQRDQLAEKFHVS